MKKLLSLLLFIPGICFSQIVISDLPSGGSIGTAANTVNKGSLFHINQTTSGQTLTVPNPTATNFSKFIYVLDIGSASFTLSPGGNLTPGTGVILVWTGTNWNVAGNGSTPTDIPGNAATVTTIPTLSGDVSNTGNNVSVSGSVVKSVVLNTPNTLYTTPVNFSTSSSTSTGTLSLNTQSANTVFSGPSTGSAAAPTFRSLVANDIPSLTASKITDLGTAATKNVGTTSGTVAAGDDSRFDNAVVPVVFHDDGGYNRNPADNTVYILRTHIANVAVATTVNNGARFRCPKNLTFTQALISGTFNPGTNESVTFTINNVTAGTSATITSSADYSAAFSNYYTLNFSCSAGDYIEVRMSCPPWATNPTGLNQIVTLLYK